MLNVPVPFPHNGSTGYLVPTHERPTAERVRILQHKDGGEVLVARELPEGGREARLAFHARGATRELTVKLDELRDSVAAAIATENAVLKLKGHRREQLGLLYRAGAFGRDSAVAVSFGGGYRHVTLSRLADEGLVEHAMLPFNGDSRRRVSHYWLSDEGRRLIAAAAQ